MKCMAETSFIRVEEIVNELDISEASVYKLIRTLNEGLKQKGFYIVRGRVSRQYFEERVYGVGKKAIW